MVKSRILLIKTGGTIAQKPDVNGVLNVSSADYLIKVGGLRDLANVDVKDVGSIDSTDMETNLRFENSGDKGKDRAAIAGEIYKNASKYDGFVVVHGTDTMVETAAALTYMLPNFRKPIVLTGSQRSAWVPRSDGPNNVFTAVQTATKDLGEVAVVFGNYVLRGTRAKKIDEEGFDAFHSPGVEPIGKVIALEEGVRLAPHAIKRKKFRPKLFTDFDTRVFNYDHVSGATIDGVLNDIAKGNEVQGILMGGFGAGNIPSRLLGFIKTAKENYKPVYVYTKCDIGAADMGLYAVGAAPLQAGAIPAGDMTPEALGQKLMCALGIGRKFKGQKRLDFIESLIRTPFNGDITVTEARK